jgi:hypothetical protein
LATRLKALREKLSPKISQKIGRTHRRQVRAQKRLRENPQAGFHHDQNRRVPIGLLRHQRVVHVQRRQALSLLSWE